MAARRASGAFPKNPSIGGQILGDLLTTGIPQPPVWSVGATAVTKVNPQPTPLQKWVIQGWTISYLGYAFLNPGLNIGGPNQSFARNAELWAGLTIGQPLVAPDDPNNSYPAVALPQDLSTFVRLWSMNEDAAWPQDSIASSAPRSLRGLTYILPQPVEIDYGDQLTMALILTPTLGSGISLGVVQASYTVLYDEIVHAVTG